MFKYILAVSVIAISGSAQTPERDKSLRFEVASIKPAQPPTADAQGNIPIIRASGGPGTNDPGRVRYPNTTLKRLLVLAYDVKNFQISGPGWLDSERFDVNATMSPKTTREQLQIMLQNLLIDRFQLAVHHENKELPVYSLVVAKAGKLKESKADNAPATTDSPVPPPPSGPSRMGADGFPVESGGVSSRPGMIAFMVPGRARLTATAQTMGDLANRLSAQLNRPVVDNTGLTVKYDFTLTYTPAPNEGLLGGGAGQAMISLGGESRPGSQENSAAPDGETPPPLVTALQMQLGLKLESKKGEVDTIVIDKMEKIPTEN